MGTRDAMLHGIVALKKLLWIRWRGLLMLRFRDGRGCIDGAVVGCFCHAWMVRRGASLVEMCNAWSRLGSHPGWEFLIPPMPTIGWDGADCASGTAERGYPPDLPAPIEEARRTACARLIRRARGRVCHRRVRRVTQCTFESRPARLDRPGAVCNSRGRRNPNWEQLR